MEKRYRNKIIIIIKNHNHNDADTALLLITTMMPMKTIPKMMMMRQPLAANYHPLPPAAGLVP